MLHLSMVGTIYSLANITVCNPLLSLHSWNMLMAHVCSGHAVELITSYWIHESGVQTGKKVLSLVKRVIMCVNEFRIALKCTSTKALSPALSEGSSVCSDVCSPPCYYISEEGQWNGLKL